MAVTGNTKTYRCAHCDQEFDHAPDWTESDAIMEYQDRFSEEIRSDQGRQPIVVCEDCYSRMMGGQLRENELDIHP